jgi:hypothetical protein
MILWISSLSALDATGFSKSNFSVRKKSSGCGMYGRRWNQRWIMIVGMCYID